MSEGECRQIAEDAVELRVGSAKQAQSVAKLLRVQNTWRDVVPGLATVTAVFDPVRVSAETVKSALKQAAETAPHQIEEDCVRCRNIRALWRSRWAGPAARL